MSQSTRLSWLLAIFVVAVLPSSAFAVETIKTESVQAEDIRLSTQGKEEVVQRPIVVATTDIRDPQIVAKNGADVTLLFTLFNAEGVQSGVVYGVELRQDNRLVDVVTFNEQPLTLSAGESLPVSFTYHAPSFFSGTYAVWIVAKTTSGMPLSLYKVGDVLLQGSVQGVSLSDCSVQVAGEKYSLTAGVDVSDEEAMTIDCVALNQSGQAIDVGPQFTSHERSVYGPLVETEIVTGKQMTLPKEVATNISFEIPKAKKPQAYDAVFELVTDAGVVVSPKVIAHYVLQGASATVQNVIFDKASYASGDIADLLITWSLAADAFSGARGGGTALTALSLSVAVADMAGTFCSSPTIVSLQNGSTVTAAKVPIIGTCVGPQLLVGISTENGALLTSQSYEYTPVMMQEELKSPTAISMVVFIVLGILVAMAGLVIVAIKLLQYVLKNREILHPKQYEPTGSVRESVSLLNISAVMISFGLGASVLLGVGVTSVEAITINVASGMDTVTFMVNTDKTTYVVDESVQVFGAAFVTGCGNSIVSGGLEVEDGAGIIQTVGTFTPYSSTMFDQSVVGYHTPGNKNMFTRAYVEAGNILNSALGNLSMTVICGANAVFDGTNCVSTNPSPAAALSGANCTIAIGEGTCTTNFNWSITNATAPSVRNVTTNTVYSYNNTGTNESRTIQYGTNVVAAFNDMATLEAVPVYGTCEPESSWDGSICAATAAPSATITTSSCEIVAGGNSCGITMNWEIHAATSPNIYNYTTAVPYSTSASGTNVPQTISYGTHDIEARDGVTVLNQSEATAVCENNTAWDGMTCATIVINSAPTLTLTANGDIGATTITVGDDVTLAWNTTGVIDECLASGDWSGPKVIDSSELMTNVLSNRTFTLICTGPGGSAEETVSVQTIAPANLVPAGLSLNPSSVFNPVTGVYDSVYVQYSVHNDGGISVGAFTNRLSFDQGGDGVYENSVESITGGLSVGADSSLFPVYLASNVPFGTHKLRLIVDTFDVIDEGDESDNELVVTLSVPVPDPGLELSANPKTVRTGQSTVLSYDTNATFPMHCEILGPQVNYDFNPSVSGATGTVSAGPLTSKSEFMLRCTEPTSNTIFTKTTWVEIIPTIQEI
ncbi:hypothetical protein GW766_02425 [Candidatus Parcubacteria bacterium]|nr:hypothetical protein [Candidatus Parcubacteria bacterium]